MPKFKCDCELASHQDRGVVLTPARTGIAALPTALGVRRGRRVQGKRSSNNEPETNYFTMCEAPHTPGN
jgi:hypothetical protein